ncbi:unnamed protein product [Clonostachys byssicola]|uniref:Serine aminopeptidase S33 domain-containing protein n=1 Tax=Clonostachys byssicola TaxID=160290 RepID=A0A9N9XYG4_9HYPO|nr:unnamed protein product [Clonostachys byssicola]
MSTNLRENIEIETHDGFTLRERFQAAGFAAIVFDHRNWGESDGLPRHHTDHYQQTQDLHDVVYYASIRPGVDQNRIALWGSSFSGGIVMAVGAVDPRVQVVITQVPFVSGHATRRRMAPDVLTKIFSDRGQTSFHKPSYVPTFPESLDQAQKDPDAAVLGTEESWYYSQTVKAFGQKKENKITLQSLFHAIRAEPSVYATQLSPKPFFMAVGLADSLIDPKVQLDVFEMAKEPKELLKMDCGHFDVYQGGHFEENISHQIEFLRKNL